MKTTLIFASVLVATSSFAQTERMEKSPELMQGIKFNSLLRSVEGNSDKNQLKDFKLNSTGSTSLQKVAIGQDGNGGGGFCYSSGKCVTLAEAGLRVPNDIPLFMISEDVEKEIRLVIGKLPENTLFGGTNDLITRTLGNRDTFIPVEQANVPKFDDIIAEYKKLIQLYAPNLPVDRFTLFAVSDPEKDITYLLPPFFDLSARQQALTLIHEADVRAMGTKIMPYALRLDGVIYDYLLSSGNSDRIDLFLASFDWRTNSDVRPYYSINPGQVDLFTGLLTILSEKVGRPLRMEEFCPAFYGNCEVKRAEALTGNKNIDPRFAKLFLGAMFETKKPQPLADDGPDAIGPNICPTLSGNPKETKVVMSKYKDNYFSKAVILECDLSTKTRIESLLDFSNIAGIHTH